MNLKNKAVDFEVLCDEVKSCLVCPRMKNSSRVLNGSCGSINAEIMFIGEAPGRLGADGSEIPFHGDKAGDNFERFLKQVGITRYQLFVTNAALCNPKDKNGNNSTPTAGEIKNCSSFLKRQIDIVNPKLVVTLGGSALKAIGLIEKHNLVLADSVRNIYNWYGRKLIPLFHPGQRAMIHRSFANQLSDYQFVSEQIKRYGYKAQYASSSGMKQDVNDVVDFITFLKPMLSYFALHKLLYLVEYEAKKSVGNKMTGSYFIRQKDGPYCTDLHYKKILKSFDSIKMERRNNQFILKRDMPDLFDRSTGLRFNSIGDANRSVILKVVEKYGDLSNKELKNKVYMTSPMRNILREEKSGRNLYNSPIEF